VAFSPWSCLSASCFSSFKAIFPSSQWGQAIEWCLKNLVNLAKASSFHFNLLLVSLYVFGHELQSPYVAVRTMFYSLMIFPDLPGCIPFILNQMFSQFWFNLSLLWKINSLVLSNNFNVMVVVNICLINSNSFWSLMASFTVSLVLTHHNKMVWPSANIVISWKWDCPCLLNLISHLSYLFWVDAFVTSVIIIKRLPSILEDVSPYFKFFKKGPDYSLFRSFGCSCFPLLRPYSAHKLVFRSKQ
jgi:hypothetical protein